jgi:serine phosphatase RsbU (regulator of sigma subunit)
LQLSMLPKELPQIKNLEISVYMKTATEVGGDYYDFSIKNDESLNIALGDATGHGMKAGTLVSMIKSLFIANSVDKSLEDFFTTSNVALKNSKLDKMMIAFAMININSNKLKIANAGIPPIYFYRKMRNYVEEINLNGLPLGAMNNSNYDIYESELAEGDTIILFSDGFPELQNTKGEMYGYERIKKVFTDNVHKSPEEIISYLKNEGTRWVNDKEPDDDVTFVVIKIK